MTYYNFSNVRYAAPPTGGNRFKLPRDPAVDRTIQTGLQEAICPQAFPGWENIAMAVLQGQTINGTGVPPFSTADIPPVDPRTSEDCLFLDILVPTAVYECKTGRAPVVVWIHSGGYVMGYKDQFGHGLGLVTRSQQEEYPGVIFVAINYRLGLFVGINPSLAYIEVNMYQRAGSPEQAMRIMRLKILAYLIRG